MLKWYVYRHDVNAKLIEKYNVFDHSGFDRDIKKLIKSKCTKEEFSEELKRIALYCFWSKCEMETVICSWPVYIDAAEYSRITNEVNERKRDNRIFRVSNVNPEVGMKIDIYDQLQLNWDVFVDYVWNNTRKES